MKKTNHIVTRAAHESAAVVEQFCQANGQILLPIVNLIQSASHIVESVIHEIGVQTLEMLLKLSAEQVAGPRTPGKASGEIRHYGSQLGQVKLADRKVQVKRPRLRHKTEGEVKIPAYEALCQDRGLSQHMLGSLREGMKEMFTLQRLQIPVSLHKCLATTNIIESPHSGVRRRTHNVSRWRDSDMVQRWVASAWLLTEKHFRRIDGHENLWALAAILGSLCEKGEGSVR